MQHAILNITNHAVGPLWHVYMSFEQ